MDAHTKAFSVRTETQLESTTMTSVILFQSLKSALNYAEAEGTNLKAPNNQEFKLTEYSLEFDRPYFYGLGFDNNGTLISLAVAEEKIYE